MAKTTIADTTHPSYSKNASMWERCRDCVGGEQDVKHGGTKYLPVQGADVKPDSTAYFNFKERAYFYNMSGNTVDALVGLAFKEDPQMNSDDWDNASYIAENADGAVTPLSVHIKNTLNDVVTTGRGGLLVEYPTTDGETTLADDKELQSTIQYYPTESIVNWGSTVVGGKKKLAFVVLKESNNDGVELWDWEIKEQYRLLKLDESGQVVGQLYDENGEPVGDEYEIIANGEHLTEIPFFVITESGDWDSVPKSPILKIVDTNVAHYRVDAELKQCMHLHSNPIPVGTGLSNMDIERMENVALGGEMLLFSQGTFDLKQINFASSGFRDIQNDLVSRAIELGARLITPQAGGVESAEAIRLRQAGDISTMASIVLSVTTAYERAIVFVNKFMAGTKDIEPSIELNDEMIRPAPDGSLVTAFVGLMDRGVIGTNIIREYLRSVGVITHAMTDEQIQEQIDGELTGTPFPNNDPDNSGAE